MLLLTVPYLFPPITPFNFLVLSFSPGTHPVWSSELAGLNSVVCGQLLVCLAAARSLWRPRSQSCKHLAYTSVELVCNVSVGSLLFIVLSFHPRSAPALPQSSVLIRIYHDCAHVQGSSTVMLKSSYPRHMCQAIWFRLQRLNWLPIPEMVICYTKSCFSLSWSTKQAFFVPTYGIASFDTYCFRYPRRLEQMH